MSATGEAAFVIETRALTESYRDVVAVGSLTLRVPRVGVFGFLGPNASGMSAPCLSKRPR